VVLLGVALLLVVGIDKVLAGGSNGQEPGPRAATVAGSPTPTVHPSTAATTGHKTKTKKKSKPAPPPLAQPTGPCVDSDVVVTPQIDAAHAAGDVPITLLFSTKVSEACTYVVSPDSVVLKLTSGSDRIWSSQQCTKAIPTTTVIARPTVPGRVVVRWNGQRSNDDCSRSAGWALPGYYHAVAAALGSDPADVQFLLHSPVARTITPKPKIKHLKATPKSG
jgi:hypothetical protein